MVCDVLTANRLGAAALILSWLTALWAGSLALAGDTWGLALLAASGSPIAYRGWQPRRTASPHSDRQTRGEHRAELVGPSEL